jgi:hypothetical protein
MGEVPGRHSRPEPPQDHARANGAVATRLTTGPGGKKPGTAVTRSAEKTLSKSDAWKATRPGNSPPSQLQGPLLIGEDVLCIHGVSDFEGYAVKPGHPLMADLFL